MDWSTRGMEAWGRPSHAADRAGGMRLLVGCMRWRGEYRGIRMSGQSLRTLRRHRQWIDEREGILQLALGFFQQSRALVGIESCAGECEGIKYGRLFGTRRV